MKIECPGVGSAEEDGAEGIEEEEGEGGEGAVDVEEPVPDGGAAEAVDGWCDVCAEVGGGGGVGGGEARGYIRAGGSGDGGCEVGPEEAVADALGRGVRVELDGSVSGRVLGGGVVSPDPGLGAGLWIDRRFEPEIRRVDYNICCSGSGGWSCAWCGRRLGRLVIIGGFNNPYIWGRLAFSKVHG